MSAVNDLKKSLGEKRAAFLRDRVTLEVHERLEVLEATAAREDAVEKIDGKVRELESRMKRLEHLISHIAGPVDGKKT